MKKTKILILATLVALFFAGCKPEQSEPAYITINAVTLDRGNDDNWNHKESGFFSNLIDAVSVSYWVKGDKAWTTLGAFQLPCTIPVLREGEIDTMQIEPIIKQNGIASTRIYYPYYRSIGLGRQTLVPGQVLNLDTLHTTFKSSNTVKVAWEEYFTPTSNIRLDSVVRLVTHPDTVLSGNGCGVIRVSPDQTSVDFWTDSLLVLNNPSAYVYLEMDYWTDFELSVGFNNPERVGGANIINAAMTLYRNTHWQKIYINLGKLWRQYNNYPYIRLYFTALNGEKRSGNIYLDNMKVVVM